MVLGYNNLIFYDLLEINPPVIASITLLSSAVVVEPVLLDKEGLEAVEALVSTVKVTELLASEPSLLVLPAASENLELATEITPLVVLSAVGVKVVV